MIEGLNPRVNAKNRNYMTPLLLVIVIFLALMLVLSSTKSVECTVPENLKVTYDQQETMAADKLEGTYWACNGLVCDRFYTPQEWINKFCFVQDNQNVCLLQTPEGEYIVPMDQVNVSAIQQCAQYLCLQEIMVRNASYVIPAP